MVFSFCIYSAQIQKLLRKFQYSESEKKVKEHLIPRPDLSFVVESKCIQSKVSNSKQNVNQLP